MRKVFSRCYTVVFLALMSVLMASVAFAESVSTTTSNSMPWETGLSNLRSSLTGPVAATVAVAAFALCTWQIIRGAELSSWVAPMIVAALAVATMVNADDLIELLGGSTIDDVQGTAVVMEVDGMPSAAIGG